MLFSKYICIYNINTSLEYVSDWLSKGNSQQDVANRMGNCSKPGWQVCPPVPVICSITSRMPITYKFLAKNYQV